MTTLIEYELDFRLDRGFHYLENGNLVKPALNVPGGKPWSFLDLNMDEEPRAFKIELSKQLQENGWFFDDKQVGDTSYTLPKVPIGKGRTICFKAVSGIAFPSGTVSATEISFECNGDFGFPAGGEPSEGVVPFNIHLVHKAAGRETKIIIDPVVRNGT